MFVSNGTSSKRLVLFIRIFCLFVCWFNNNALIILTPLIPSDIIEWSLSLTIISTINRYFNIYKITDKIEKNGTLCCDNDKESTSICSYIDGTKIHCLYFAKFCAINAHLNTIKPDLPIRVKTTCQSTPVLSSPESRFGGRDSRFGGPTSPLKLVTKKSWKGSFPYKGLLEFFSGSYLFDNS